MAGKRSVYLSSQTLGLQRRRDSLSGRINQVSDRYGGILRDRGPPLRAMFTSAEWDAMLDACAAWHHFDCLAALDAGCASPRWSSMPYADRVIIAELLEADL